MRPKTLLILALAVLGLGAFIFLYEKDLPSTDERAAQAKKILQLEESDISSIGIEWGERKVRLERQPAPNEQADDPAPESTWKLAEPIRGRADRSLVESLLRSLLELESTREITDFRAADLGLDDPRARLTLETEDGQSVLAIGAEVPASSDMLVTLEGSAVAHQAAARIFSDLTREPGEWRDRSLFSGIRSEIESVTLEGAHGPVELSREGEDFRLANLDDRADESQVNTLMSELTSLKARAFLDQTPLTPAGMGLEPAAATVRVALASSPEFEVELGRSVDGEGAAVYGRVEDQLFETETRLTELLELDATAWRSRSWSTLQVFEVESAQIEDSEGTLDLRRDGADWKRGEDRIPYSAVSDLLYPITELEADEILDRPAALERGFDLENPAISISFTDSEPEDEAIEAPVAELLSLSTAVEGWVAATSAGRDAVLVVAETRLAEIQEKLGELRGAKPLAETDEPSSDEPAHSHDASGQGSD